MSLAELNDHITRLRDDLEAKKADLDRLLFTDPVTGMVVRYQIDCLEPRLRELERQAFRLTKEREAHELSNRVPGDSVDHGTGPIPVVL